MAVDERNYLISYLTLVQLLSLIHFRFLRLQRRLQLQYFFAIFLPSLANTQTTKSELSRVSGLALYPSDLKIDKSSRGSFPTTLT